MYSIELLCRGLIGLVPKRENEADRVEGVVLVAPNVFLGSATQPPELPGPMPPHTACLVVAANFVDRSCSDREPDLEFKRNGVEHLLYRMRGEDLAGENLRFDPAPSGELILVDEGLAKEEPGPGEETDLSWLPSLSKSGLEGAGFFNRDLLDDKDRPLKASVIGTISVPAGTVSGRGTRTDALGTHLVFRFHPLMEGIAFLGMVGEEVEEVAGPVFRQAMSAGVKLTLPFASDGVSILFSRAGGPDERVCLRLPSGFATPLRVFNLELEEILEIGSGTELIRKVADPDFAAFYPLSVGWPQFKERPLPIPFVPKSFGGRGRVNCDSPKYLGWRSASSEEG